MNPILIIIFFSLILFSCNSNTTKDSKIETVSPSEIEKNNFNEIGFACGADGQETKLVEEFTKLIKDKNYKQLKSSLYSSEPGIFYLSTISCTKLSQEGMMKLNSSDLKQIEKNHNKTDTIYTCSGCTNQGYYSIKQLLNDTTNFINQEAEWWFDEILGKNIIE